MSQVLYSETVPWPNHGARGAFFWSTVLAALGATSALALEPTWARTLGILAALIGIAGMLMATSFRQLKLSIDPSGIRWSFGLIKKFVPADKIVMFGARSFKREQGTHNAWGITPAQEGPENYLVWGQEGEVIALVERAGDDVRRHLITTRKPGAVVKALVAAQDGQIEMKVPSCQTEAVETEMSSTLPIIK